MEEKKLQKIGLMGGSFDPIHLGHLIVAEYVAGHLGLDSVSFIPCCRPPHKDSDGLTDGRQRLRMVELATEGNPRFRAAGIEIARGGVSYSVDTVNALRSRLPRGTRFYFIIGADSLREIHTWKNYKMLLPHCVFVTAGRPGYDRDGWVPEEGLFSPEELASLREHFVPAPLIGISATEIRRRRQAGRSIRYLVPDKVERYIGKNKLYI